MTLDLFGEPSFPAGFDYRPEVLTIDEEATLIEQVSTLPFKEFEFHGFLGKRRTVSFGWTYDFAAATLRSTVLMPDYLAAIRRQMAEVFGREDEVFEQVLVSEYGPGAGIGWHRDKAVFGEIIGLSLGASSTLRLRQQAAGKWRRVNTVLEPRSAYLFSGSVRSDWEHSIPPVAEHRYSLTFRTLA